MMSPAIRTSTERSRLADIDIAILAGGLGTRLGGVLPDRPKILAPINGKPFIDHLLQFFIGQGARHLLFCLGHRADQIIARLQSVGSLGAEIETVTEPEPLGTAGALANAATRFRASPVMVVNGDTLVEADLNAFLSSHFASNADTSILCTQVDDARRYGRVEKSSSLPDGSRGY